MAAVSVSRFIQATPPEIRQALTPEMIIHYEGTFTVRDITSENGRATVSVSAPGITAEFIFEERPNGYYYKQVGDDGPFNEMETTITYSNHNEGVMVTMESSVSLGLRPRFLAERIGGWKRKGELKRALKNLKSAIE